MAKNLCVTGRLWAALGAATSRTGEAARAFTPKHPAQVIVLGFAAAVAIGSERRGPRRCDGHTAFTGKNRLKVLRAERDWSQAELADQLSVSRQTVNALETGKYDPSLPLAFKIAQLFGMRIEDVFDPS